MKSLKIGACVLAISLGIVDGSVVLAASTDETFVIVANRRPIPLREVGASVSTVTADELAAQGIQYVEEALRRLPGVAVSTSGGPGGQVAVRLRGEEAYRTLVLIDGIRVSDPTLPQVAPNLANLAVASIERIEVLRGPQALLYGADAIGGVINIVTRRGGEMSGEFSVEAGSFETYTARGFTGGSSGAVDFGFGGSWSQTEGFSAKQGDPTLADDDGYQNLTLHGVIGVALSGGTQIEAVGRYVDAEAEFDGFAFDPDRELLTEEMAARLALTTTELGAGLTHMVAYNYFQTRRQDLDGGKPTVDWLAAPISRFDGNRHEIEYLGSIDPLNGHGFTFGGEYEIEEAITDSLSNTSHTFAGFAEWQAVWAASFFTTLGVRYDAPEDFDEHVSLRATTAWLVNLTGENETKFRASAGTGFRAPSPYERARNLTLSLPAMNEETAIGFDVGVDQPFANNRGQISVTYFDQRVEDEIRFDNVGFTGYFQSSGTTHSRGVEVGLNADLGHGFMLSTNYTYTDATVNSPDPENGLPRVRRPKHITSTDLDYEGTGGRFRANLNLRTAAEAEDGFREFRVPLEDYTVINASASYELMEGLEFTARVNNLFDEQYQEVAGFSTMGQAVFIGFRARF